MPPRLLATLTLTLAIPLAALGQSPSPDSARYNADPVEREEDIETVIVRGTQTLPAEPRATLGASSRVVIKNAQVGQDLRNLSASSPNLYLQPSGLRISSPIYVRGVGSTMGPPPMGLYLDGTPVFDRDAFILSLVDVRFVEMLRGPQSARYGRTSLIGQMNVESAAPRSTPALRAQIGMGSYMRTTTLVGGDIPTPQWRSRLLATRATSDGFHRNSYDNSWNTPQESYLARYRGMGTWAWGTLDLTAWYSFMRDDGYGYHAIDSLLARPYYTRYNGTSQMVRHRARIQGLAYGGIGRSDMEWRVASSISYNRDYQLLDADFTAFDVYQLDRYVEQHAYTLEANLQGGSTKEGFSWLAGLFGFARGNQTDLFALFGEHKRFLLGPASGIVDSMNYYNTTYEANGAAYGTVAYTWPELDIQIAAQLRYSYESSWLRYHEYLHSSVLGGQPWKASDDRRQYHAILPKIAFEWNPGPVRLWLSAARGAKPGGFNSIDNKPIGKETKLAFEQEEVWSYDLGMDYLPTGGTRIALSGSFMDWRNQQIFMIEAMGPAIRNAGNVYALACELEVNSMPLSWLQLNASGGYNFTKYYKHKVQDFVGKRSIVAPSFTLSLEAQGRWYWGDVGLSASVGYSAYGLQYFDERNSLGQPFHGTLRADITTSYRGVYLRVSGTNLIGTQYFTHMFYSPLGNDNPAYSQLGQLGAPREIMVTVGCDLSK